MEGVVVLQDEASQGLAVASLLTQDRTLEIQRSQTAGCSWTYYIQRQALWKQIVNVEGPLLADFLDNLTEGFDCALRGEYQRTICPEALLRLWHEAAVGDMLAHIMQGVSLEPVLQNGHEDGCIAAVVESKEKLLIRILGY